MDDSIAADTGRKRSVHDVIFISDNLQALTILCKSYAGYRNCQGGIEWSGAKLMGRVKGDTCPTQSKRSNAWVWGHIEELIWYKVRW